MDALGLPDPVERAAAQAFRTELVTLRRDVAAEVIASWTGNDAVADFARYAGTLIEAIETSYQAASLAALDMIFGLLADRNAAMRPSEVLLMPADRITRVVESTGPALVARLEQQGYAPDAAREAALRRTSLAVQQILTDTANYQAEQAIGANRHVLQAHGRLASPTACAFCKRLAGGARYRAVYNVTERWRRPHPNCACTIVPLGRYRLVRVRSATEIAAGRALHAQIKAAKDRAAARSGQASGRLPGGYRGAERITLPPEFRPVRIA